MISEKMKPYVKNNSAIRMMFEEGIRNLSSHALNTLSSNRNLE